MTGRTFPDFVVAGAARAGSTAVVESLRRRPDVFITQPKEPHYLALAGTGAPFSGPGDDLTINKVLVRTRDAYEQLFSAAPPGSMTGEGSVSTLYYAEQATARLRELNRNARVVIVLREPVARAFSSHQYLVNRGYEQETDFRRAVALEEERISAGWHHLWHYMAMSRYAQPVAHLLQSLPSGSVGIWWYDDLMADEERTLARIQSFLGLPPVSGQLSAGRVNASGTPRHGWMQTGMQVASCSPALRRLVKAVIPFEARERIRGANLAATGVSPDVHAALAPRFASDLDRLEAVLHRPVPAGWRR